jgi:hypothetical protein
LGTSSCISAANARQWIVSVSVTVPIEGIAIASSDSVRLIPKVELLELCAPPSTKLKQVLADWIRMYFGNARTIQGKDVELLEAIFHVTEHFSMHTGQIILLTKMLAQTDMTFYDFSSGAPLNRWNT